MEDKTFVVEVGGRRFFLDPESIKSLKSDFLAALLDPQSEFKKPQNGVYKVDADAECFAAFLHFARFGNLPCRTSKEDLMIEQADFWGIGEDIKNEVFKPRNVNCLHRKIADLRVAEVQSKMHHNFREFFGQGRIYCLGFKCAYRDIDTRVKDVTKYKNCERCSREINYKSNLGWCHKCGLCKICQASEFDCPNNYATGNMYCTQVTKTTENIREEIGILSDEFENLLK